MNYAFNQIIFTGLFPLLSSFQLSLLTENLPISHVYIPFPHLLIFPLQLIPLLQTPPNNSFANTISSTSDPHIIIILRILIPILPIYHLILLPQM